MFGGPHRVDELTRTEPVGWTGKTIRELRRSAGPRNNGAAQLWECVRKEQKKELNTLDEADFVRDVENRDYHYLSHFEIAGAKRIYQHLLGAVETQDKKRGNLVNEVNSPE